MSLSTISSAGLSSGASKLSELLHAFAVLAPPERVIHVGTGSRQSDTLCWRDWALSEAVVIDSEEQDFEQIHTGLNSETKLYKHSVVLAESVGPADYYVANNLSENGLIDPTLLRMVWPSLALSHRSKKDALILDSLVADKALQSWLIIDCLPAVRILSGSINTLKDTLIVCVRALAEPGFRGEPVDADIKSIDSWLDMQGFKRLAFITGLNPKIGHAIYGRPAEKPIEPQDLPLVKALNQELESVRKELLQTLDEKNRVYADLTKERDANEMRAAELEAHLKTVADQHVTATAEQVNAHIEAQAALQAKLTEVQQQVVVQTQAKDKALQQLAEAQKSVGLTKQSLTDAQNALAVVQKSEAEAKKTAEATAATLKQVQTTQQEIQTKLDAITKERDATKTRTSELEVQLKTAAEQHVAATAQQAKVHTEAQAALQAKLIEAQKQVEAQIQAKNQALEQVVAQTQAKDKALQQFAEAQKSVEATQKSLADSQSALAAVQKSEAEAKKIAETTAVSLKQAQATQQEIQTKLDAVAKERDALKTHAVELEAQLKTVAEQHAAATVQQAKAHTEAQLALQAKLTEAQQQVEAQAQAKDKALQQLSEAQKSVETKQKSLTEVEKVAAEAKKSLETTTATLKAKESALQAELSRIQTLTAENQELAHRQQLMNEELIKAEGQISLIKDLLLREQGI